MNVQPNTKFSKLIIVKGGRTGQKAHYAQGPDTSVLLCGHWLKGRASFFALDFKTKEEVVEAGYGFCAKCEEQGAQDWLQEPVNSTPAPRPESKPVVSNSGLGALSAMLGQAFLQLPKG